ncbi:hypothetical protein [Vibrio aestuarianus]|uniref:hypothetical protein n=1 Tax=Vibrio aestuarianus TaxID=28171 RepID=UPI001592E17B|nr:hypothetical protein [Vibrio aestuarianus]MDE1235800.1 hypothetical protein [Vibrio aestuarianus]MDE1246644.1 hypothetical protein [Vibrio aestuarianus]NGZ63793.1 hypothetical protein [Vibrio aestuarianus subsp. cardii]
MSDQTVLEQANAALAEARKVLQKSEENLSKSRQANDYSLSLNRKLAHSLVSLMNNEPRLVSIDCAIGEQLKEVVHMANGSSITFLNNETRDIYDVIHAINVLAMANTDVIQVFTAFGGSSKSFDVSAFDVSTDWSDKKSKKERLLDETIFLGIEPNPLKKLLFIESQLTELIIEAREASEAKAEQA